MDRNAWRLTDFAGKIESGLFKMMTIGLGKFAGAQRYHTYGYRLGLEYVIRTAGRQVINNGKVLAGLAILEDANHNTAQLAAVPVEHMEQKEEELLWRRHGYEGGESRHQRGIQSVGDGATDRSNLLARQRT
ncbi:MAG: hypothetical protein ABSB35_20425 [Bryobacteraceae bacterium]|jgi:hypothetical protein